MSGVVGCHGNKELIRLEAGLLCRLDSKMMFEFQFTNPSTTFRAQQSD
jgi:hypothetical protein